MKRGIFLLLTLCLWPASAKETAQFQSLGTTANAGEAWLDKKAKKIWTDPVEGRFHRDRAQAACDQISFQGLKFRVPSADDFAELERHGGRAHLPKMKDHFFWTGTAHPSSSNVRQLYNGNTGSLFWVMYNNITFDSVRCVAVQK